MIHVERISEEISEMKDLCVSLFLAIAAYQDVKSREISIRLCAIFAIMGIVINVVELSLISNFCAIMLLENTVALLPGVILLVIALLSEENIGAGDGVVVIIMGIFMGLGDTVTCVFLSMLLVAMVSVVLLVAKRVNRKQTFPYVPYIFVVKLMCIISNCM